MTEKRRQQSPSEESQESAGEGPLMATAEKLRRELDRWLEAAFEQGERALDVIRPGSSRHWTPAVDIIETDEQVRVVVDLPGVDPSGVDVSLAGNMLTIKGDKPETPSGEGQTVHLRQRSRGAFSRSIPMPAPIDSEAVSADAHSGVLTIVLNKTPRAKARHIRVKAARSEGKSE